MFAAECVRVPARAGVSLRLNGANASVSLQEPARTIFNTRRQCQHNGRQETQEGVIEGERGHREGGEGLNGGVIDVTLTL